MLGQRQKTRIDEGQSAFEASVKGSAESVAAIFSGGATAVAQADYEIVKAYLDEEITHAEMDEALSEVAGGQSAATVLAVIVSRRTSGTWTGRPPESSVAPQKSASTPIGRKGQPINVPKGTNEAFKIRGRNFVDHAGDTMQGRGIPPSVVKNAIRTGRQSPAECGRTAHYDSVNNITVITENNGRTVISVRYGDTRGGK